MNKLVFAIAFFWCCTSTFANDFIYSFKISSVDSPGMAKQKILELRELLGVKTIRFSDDTDLFEIHTHLDFSVEEMLSDLNSIGIVLVGPITKTNKE